MSFSISIASSRIFVFSGCDCVGNVWYFDAVFVDSGEILKIPNCVCIHEEDTGMLWKHTEFRTGQTEVPFIFSSSEGISLCYNQHYFSFFVI